MAGKGDQPWAGAPGEPAVSSKEPLAPGDAGRTTIPAPCPVCHALDAALRTVTLEVPYFGEVFESVFLCGACGFRHADTLLPRISEPTEFRLAVEEERDMVIRAVKSSSATVSIPELGLLWEPGPASIAEVTNVEGLIQHFEDAVLRARALFPEEKAQARADELEALLAAVREGGHRVTLVVQDPYGNSALIADTPRLARRVMSPDEAAALSTGEYVLEASREGRPHKLRPTDGPRRAH